MDNRVSLPACLPASQLVPLPPEPNKGEKRHTPHQSPHTTYQINQLALDTIISTAASDTKGRWVLNWGI